MDVEGVTEQKKVGSSTVTNGYNRLITEESIQESVDYINILCESVGLPRVNSASRGRDWWGRKKLMALDDMNEQNMIAYINSLG